MDTRIRFPSILCHGKREEEKGLIIGRPGWVGSSTSLIFPSNILYYLGNVGRKSVKIPGNFIQLGDTRMNG